MTDEKPVPAESLEEPAHAEFSPSSLSMFEKCPAGATETNPLPNRKRAPASTGVREERY